MAFKYSASFERKQNKGSENSAATEYLQEYIEVKFFTLKCTFFCNFINQRSFNVFL